MSISSIHNLPWGRGVHVLAFEPSLQLIAVEKPVNIKSHPNKPLISDPKAILAAPYSLSHESFSLPDSSKVYLLNRLDSPTSGIVLLSTNPSTALSVKSLFKKNLISKTYFAWVKGKLSPPSQIWKNSLQESSSNNQLRVSRSNSPSRSLSAITSCKSIKFLPQLNLSLLEFTPKTGRTHQLRVHSQLNNHPILGDKTYGDFSWNNSLFKSLPNLEKRLYLHAASISLSLNNIPFSAHSPLPPSFTLPHPS